MNRLLLFCLVALLTGSYTDCQAQKNQPFGFHLLKKRHSTRIPFQTHANLIIVPVRINSSDTLRFILDTGVGNTIITDPALIPYINSNYVRTIRLEGVGRDSTLEAGVSIGNELQIGSALVYQHNVLILKEDVLKLSELVGAPVHGLIGYDFFERFVVTIDFRHRELVVRSPRYHRYRRRSQGSKIPLEMISKKPYIDGIVIKEAGKSARVKLLLDTGAGHAVMLNTVGTSLPMPAQTIDVQLGIGLGGKISGQLGRMDEIRIGDHTLQQVVTSFPDSASFDSKIDPENSRQGNIGGELLRRFKVTINYPEGYLAMRPTRRAFKETFEHDMSGMDLRARGSRFSDYYVERIVEDSPADRAGLQKDDKIIFINSLAASELNMTGIYKLFQRREGRSISLVISRQGTLIFTTLVLQSVI